MVSRKQNAGMAAASMLLMIFGCAQTDLSEISYFDERPTENVRTHATEISRPNIDSPSMQAAMNTASPRTVSSRHNDEVREITLADAIYTALSNNKIIRTASTFNTNGNPILANPTSTSSYYDNAILESGVLFGQRGLESALAAFDANWTSSMTWGRDETIPNGSAFGFGVGATAQQLETAQFNSALSKVFGNGGQFTLGHNWNYTLNPANPPQFYAGSLSAVYRQPLWAGSGTEFTAIAGPVVQNFGGLSGVTQGVLIARINSDISIATFEINVRNMLYDVEQLYWDLYMSYRSYDTNVAAMKSAHQTWNESKTKYDIGTLKASDEAQARDRYYETRAQTETSLASLFDTELRFRRLLGLSVNDGTVMRPVDEPVAAEVVVDWSAALAEGLTRRTELRRHKWNVKSIQLQLRAARKLVAPRLDFEAGYNVNGFGDSVLGGGNSGFESITENNFTGWDMGFTMSIPIGFRSANAQVRNIELRLAKAMDVLAAQELEITHELGNVIQSLSEHYSVAQSNVNRLQAAQVRVEKLKLELDAGTITPDPLVRAQSSLATAEVAYYQSLTNYNKKLAEFHYRKGSLLANYNIFLSEGPWDQQALSDAARRAHERANANPDEDVTQEPDGFAFPDFRPRQQSMVAATSYEEPSDVPPSPEDGGLVDPTPPELPDPPSVNEVPGPPVEEATHPTLAPDAFGKVDQPVEVFDDLKIVKASAELSPAKQKIQQADWDQQPDQFDKLFDEISDSNSPEVDAQPLKVADVKLPEMQAGPEVEPTQDPSLNYLDENETLPTFELKLLPGRFGSDEPPASGSPESEPAVSESTTAKPKTRIADSELKPVGFELNSNTSGPRTNPRQQVQSNQPVLLQPVPTNGKKQAADSATKDQFRKDTGKSIVKPSDGFRRWSSKDATWRNDETARQSVKKPAAKSKNKKTGMFEDYQSTFFKVKE